MAHLAHFAFLVAMMISVGLAADGPQSALVGEGCSNPKTYTYVNVTEFQEIQKAVFVSLNSNLSSDGFATSSKSGKTDAVYGLAVCRKYLTANECLECVMEAETQVKAYCPKSNGGRVHLDGCFLRYENTSFYGDDVDAGASSYCGSTNDTDPQTFSQRVTALSRNLIQNASANNGYATGSIDGSLYGVAQCWPTLTTSICQGCLTEAQNQLLTCLPKREARGLEAGCFMRYSTYSFFTDNVTSPLANLTPPSGKSSSKVVPILLGCIGGAALVVVMCFILFYRRIRHRHRKNNDTTDDNFAARENFEQFVFDYEVLRQVTHDFDENNMLGKGGFGEVYKGILPDGTDVAVKKLNGRETTRAAEDFLTEVKLLTSVRHRNLVRLLGCCTRGHDRLLVYEFMSNNSLNKHLFGEIRNVLSWENRLNIIVGTAKGLAYLHEDSNVRIIHRDIKCANILLDDRLHPKIADFGMARFFPEGETHVSTRIGGTVGYTAPEYATYGQLTEKADVYSYGVVVLEILSGRKCVDARSDASMQLILEWAWNQFQNNQVLDIVDSSLEGNYPEDQALRVIKIALLCTQGQWALRPAMSEVLLMLTNHSEVTAEPTEPAFINDGSERTTRFASTVNSDSASQGSITVSLFPR
eukprot:PITA_18363